MPTEENKALVRRLYEAFNGRNLSALDEALSPDFIDHYPGSGQEPGLGGIKHVWAGLWAKFPNIRVLAEDMLAEGDKVSTRVTFQMTPTTSGDVATPGRALEIFRIIDGKVVELWNIIC